MRTQLTFCVVFITSSLFFLFILSVFKLALMFSEMNVLTKMRACYRILWWNLVLLPIHFFYIVVLEPSYMSDSFLSFSLIFQFYFLKTKQKQTKTPFIYKSWKLLGFIFQHLVSSIITESAVVAKPLVDLLSSAEGQFSEDLMNVTLMLPVSYHTS